MEIAGDVADGDGEPGRELATRAAKHGRLYDERFVQYTFCQKVVGFGKNLDFHGIS